jgi:inosose dehydratase
MKKLKPSRRIFIKTAGLGLAMSSYPGVLRSRESYSIATARKWDERIRLGLASFTFREFSLAETIAMTQRMGLKYIALKSFHLPLESPVEEIKDAADMVRAGGLELYGCSVVVLKNEKEVTQVFDYARAAGMKVITAQPEKELLDLIQKKVQEYDIKLAIHNHGPEDKSFPLPLTTYESISTLDPRIGICIDIGHTKRSGADPSDCLEKCADRLMDVHIKDIKSITRAIDPVEVGRGLLDIPSVLRSLIRINYAGIVSLEYEKDAKDPLPGVAESLGYIRGVLSVI